MNLLEMFGEATGVPMDQVKIGVVTLLSCPLGYLFLKLKLSGNARYVADIAVGIFLGWICMGVSGFIHTIISCTVAYLVCMNLKPKLALDIVWAWSLLYMLYA